MTSSPALTADKDLVYEIVKLCRQYEDGFLGGDYMFSYAGARTEDAPVQVGLILGMHFAYGGSDYEEITAEDLPALRKAYEDVAAIEGTPTIWGTTVFVCRKRNQRPNPRPNTPESITALVADLPPGPYELDNWQK